MFEALKLEGVETPAFQALWYAVCDMNPDKAPEMRRAYTLRLREVADAAHEAVQTTE